MPGAARRKFFVPADIEAAARRKSQGKTQLVLSPVALEEVRRIDALFGIERAINGLDADARKAERLPKRPRRSVFKIDVNRAISALAVAFASAKLLTSAFSFGTSPRAASDSASNRSARATVARVSAFSSSTPSGSSPERSIML